MRSVRVFAAMDPVKKNFGDALMQPLLGELFNIEAEFVEPDQADLIGVGSIIDAAHRRRWRRGLIMQHIQRTIDLARGKRKLIPVSRQLHVWGSGFLASNGSMDWPQELVFHAVRGPLSRDRVGLSELPLGDPGLLLPLIWPKPDSRLAEVAIVPNYATFQSFADRYAAHLPANWRLVDPCRPAREVVETISASDFVVASSLHGLITADAYGVPNCWMEPTNRIRGDGFKFRDYAAFRGCDLYGPIDFSEFLKTHKRIVALDECRPRTPHDRVTSALIQAFPFR